MYVLTVLTCAPEPTALDIGLAKRAVSLHMHNHSSFALFMKSEL